MTAKRKSKYKKITKGVRYITKAIVKKYPSRFKKDKAFARETARGIYENLKSSKTKVTLKSIFANLPAKERKGKQGKRSNPPILDEQLANPIHYFDLINYPIYIGRMANQPELHFESKIIPVGLEDLVAGYEYSYEDYFAPFVRYIDKLRSLDDNKTRYNDEYYVICTEPTWNNDKKYWVSEILACDIDGIEARYGFNAKDISYQPSDEYVKPEQPEKAEKPKEQPTKLPPETKPAQKQDTGFEFTQQIELEKEKQRTEKEKQRTLILELIRDSKDAETRKFFMEQLKNL